MSEFSPHDQTLLFSIARAALRDVVGIAPFDLNLDGLPPALLAPRACFVTLYTSPNQQLRGCTGTLRARLPLAQEVVYSTQNTATNDPRFPPVTTAEEPHLQIELSILTAPQPLPYRDVADLLQQLIPHQHGVTLRDSIGRAATFLPQVWAKIPDKAEFLTQLCRKMGIHPLAWQQGRLQVEVYSSEEYYEPR